MCNGAPAIAKSEVYPYGMPERPVCPVRDECLEWALESKYPIGLIGGKTERDRKILQKQRAEERAERGQTGSRPS